MAYIKIYIGVKIWQSCAKIQIFIGPHPEGGFEVNYAFPPDPFSSNPWVGSCPPPVPNPFPYSPCYSTGIYGTGANCMDPQGRHCPNCSG